MKYRELTPQEEAVIVHKGTELPFSGDYEDTFAAGTYYCKRCGAELYHSDSKFDAGCGWPSFDDEVPGSIKRIPDADGERTEIVCSNCEAHLGHVFTGEGYTPKNIRHCVNSISLIFVPDVNGSQEIAIVAGGCFWGVEHLMNEKKGVIETCVGYTGGTKENPTYEEVCSDETGHIESVRVVFDSNKTSYEEVLKHFFEIHDPTQFERQGPDIGKQYSSIVFYCDDKQKEIAEKLIFTLKEKGHDVKT